MDPARPSIDNVIPEEYRPVAENFYDQVLRSREQSTLAEAASQFAEIIGVLADFKSIMETDQSSAATKRILGHFRNNVELLVQKTWVEKADETHKEKLLDRVPSFCAKLEKGDYQRAIKPFIVILDELAYLLFGSQSRKSDFIEYSLRIDAQLGMFWWYAGILSKVSGQRNDDELRLLLYIGVCFLAAI